jgi:hypothetical protein
VAAPEAGSMITGEEILLGVALVLLLILVGSIS